VTQSLTSSLNYKGFEVTHLIKPKLKNSYIQIKNDATILVKTPRVAPGYLMEFLDSKEWWIQKHIQTIKENPPAEVNLEDEVLLFGELYSIDSPEVLYLRKKLHRTKKQDTKSILNLYDAFYKYLAKEYLTQRTEYFSKIMGLQYQELKFRKMKTRWGSCSSRGVITFNTELLKVPKELIDYVVVHELAHLEHMNHSKAFHSLVEIYLSNQKELRKQLKSTKIL